MTVAELIDFLQKQPQDLQVAYNCCSEQVLMEAQQICIEELCLPQPDGWIQSKREDMLSLQYLVFPGN